MAWFTPDPGQREAAQQMVDWINAAPPSEVAVQLLGAFAAEPPGRRGMNASLTDTQLVQWLFRTYATHWTTSYPVDQAVVEALQLLEQSQLVVFWPRLGDDSSARWLVTRTGLATAHRGPDAVRQRIRERTGFAADPPPVEDAVD